MQASIIIATFNEGDHLWKTVASCIETTADLECEIVVADDGSTDGSVAEAQKRFPRIRIASHTTRQGVAAAKALGAQNAKGDVLVFLDAHCKAEAGALVHWIDVVNRLDGHALVTPQVASLDCERWEIDKSRAGHGYKLCLETFDDQWIGLADMKRQGLYYESPNVVGTLAVTRDLYETLWGFDPRMRSWGCEHVDFGLKAWLMGYCVVHDPRPIIGHRFQRTFENYTVPSEHNLLNRIRTARKHFTDAVWQEWLERFRTRHDPQRFERAWALLKQDEDSLNRERDYLLENRVRDEYWYAQRFDLAWPVRSPTDRNSGDVDPETSVDRPGFDVGAGVPDSNGGPPAVAKVTGTCQCPDGPRATLSLDVGRPIGRRPST